MASAAHGGAPSVLRGNLQGITFWNPTTIRAEERGRHMHRMDLNECPHPPSPKVVAAMQAAAESLNRYPDGTCPVLTERITARTGIPASRICWGAGSTQLLKSIIETAVAPGDNLVSPRLLWHRFHGIYEALGADVTLVPNRADGAIDVHGLAAAVGNNTRVLVVITPNNPTGLMLPEDEVRHVIRATPDNVLLFIDEAYYEFAAHAGGPDVLALLRERQGPWVVSRTFSKAYALAGLRLGYALCSSDEVANAVRLLTSTFNISAFAEAGALAALEDADYTRFILETTAKERQRIIDGFRALGCQPMHSVTNFVSADVGRPGTEVVAAMRERGIRIARWSDPGYETYIRVSMGVPEDTDAFLTELGAVLNGR